MELNKFDPLIKQLYVPSTYLPKLYKVVMVQTNSYFCFGHTQIVKKYASHGFLAFSKKKLLVFSIGFIRLRKMPHFTLEI